MDEQQAAETVRAGGRAHGLVAEDVPPGYFRAAAGNLVREDDPLAVAFRELTDWLVKLYRVLDPVLAVRRERTSVMHSGYRRRQLARNRRRR